MGFQLPRQYINFFYHTSVLQRKHHYKFPLPSKIYPFFPARKKKHPPFFMAVWRCYSNLSTVVGLLQSTWRPIWRRFRRNLQVRPSEKRLHTFFWSVGKILGAGFNYSSNFHPVVWLIFFRWVETSNQNWMIPKKHNRHKTGLFLHFFLLPFVWLLTFFDRGVLSMCSSSAVRLY